MNLKNVMAALVVASMSLSLAPMAAAHGTNTGCSPLSGYTDEHNLAEPVPGSGIYLDTGSLDGAATGNFHFFDNDGVDRILTVTVPSGEDMEYRVLKDDSSCSEVAIWKKVSERPTLSITENSDLFIVARPVSGQDVTAYTLDLR